MSGLVVGWSYARYGWFGIDEEKPSNVTLNYIGVVLTLISCIVFMFVKVEEEKRKRGASDSLSVVSASDRLFNNSNESDIVSQDVSYISNEIAENIEESDFLERMSQTKKRILGTVLSIFAGVMFGFSYMPNLWCENNIQGASQNFNDYAFSMSTGIFLTSTVYFLIYCAWTRNKPKVYSQLIFPSLVTGI